MRILPRLVLAALVFTAAGAPARGVVRADVPGVPDPNDRLLADRALRLGRLTVARHVTPEGVLAYEHRRDATPAQLSADALKKADTGIWTGCYAASAACRYHVTKDPEALALCKRLASGLDLLSRATGVEGCISRAVGRPIPGEDPGNDVVASPLGGGLAYRNDPSRDTLTGVVLGWDCLARFCDDPEVQAYAARNLGAIARRLYAGKMHLRDVDGKTTTYGALSAKAALVFENGMHASIGLATMRAALAWDRGDDLLRAWKHLDKDGWVDALDAQYTWLPAKVTHSSNMNMVQMALAVIALEDIGKSGKYSRASLRDFRHKTRGRHNGGYLALYLLSGNAIDRGDVVDELRATLLEMPPDEVPWVGSQIVDRSGYVPMARRPVNVWAWKLEPDREELLTASAVRDPSRTFTRADWLFAYWLARAAGELNPGP